MLLLRLKFIDYKIIEKFYLILLTPLKTKRITLPK